MAINRTVRHILQMAAAAKGGGRRAPPLGPTPILLESFESTTGFTGGTNQTSTIKTDSVVQGSGALNVKAAAIGGGQSLTAFKTKTTQFDPSVDFGSKIAFAYQTDPFAMNSVQLELGRGGASFQGFSDAGANGVNRARGWRWKAFALTTPAVGVGSVQVRCRYTANSPSNADASYDALLVKADAPTPIIIGYDDNYKAQKTLAGEYMRNLGLIGQINVAEDYIEAGESGVNWRLNKADLLTMYHEWGWGMACNSRNDFAISSMTDPAGVLTVFNRARDYLIGMGFTNGGQNCLVYSEGKYKDDVKYCRATTIVADGVSTSIQVTAVSGPSTLPQVDAPYVGMKLSGFGADGFVVTNVVGSSVPFTVTVDNGAGGVIPASCTRVMFYDDSGVFAPKGKDQGPAPAPLILQQNGFVHGRTTDGGSMYIEAGPGDQALQFPGQGSTTATEAQIKGFIDTAIATNSCLEFYFHAPDGPNANDIPMSILAPVLDYIALKKSQGLCYDTTAAEVAARSALGQARLQTLEAAA